MGKKGAEEKRKMNIKRSLKFRTCAITIILFTLLFSALTIPSFNVLAQNQTELDVLDETEPEPEPTPELTPEPTPESTPEPAPEPETEEIISANLANASLITDKRIYSQGESVNISLLYVPSTATTNLTILSPSPGDIVYIALEEETGLYSFTQTTAIGTYHISANISVALETLTLTTEFVVVGEEGKEIGEGLKDKGEERGFDLNKASLSVDKATYALGETVRICLAAPPEVITNFSIINPAGTFYVILPSADGEYEFNPDSAGSYVVNVSLRTSADGEALEKFLILAAEFDVIDLGLEIVFEEPEQGEIEVGEPVNWRQHISIANHGNVSISNYAVNIPLPEDYSNLSSDFYNHKITQISTRNCGDAGCKMPDAISTLILIDLEPCENVSFNIFYQTSPVELEVVETSIDISDLIPPDAFDIGIYKQIEAGEEKEEEVFSLSLSESEVKVKQVTVLHNSSVHYHDIPVCIVVGAEEDMKVVELVNGTEKEIKAKISDKNVSWMVPELSKSNRTFMITKREYIPEQAKAEIDTPVGWQLNVLGTLIRYRTPAPFKTESAPKIENGTWKKEIVIGSNASVHYTNVTAFTNLSLEKKALPKKHEQGDIKLFLINLSSEKKGLDVTDNPAYNVSFVDTDDNGLIDQVRWNIPFLSNKTKAFEVEQRIEVINVQSYPTVGGNWTVAFNTTGTANLTITAVNGTAWTNQPYECYDEQTQILTRSEINHGITQDYTEKNNLVEICEICGLEKSRWTSPLVSLVVMSESFENNSIFLDLEGKNKTSDVDSFIIAAISPEVLEMLDGGFVAVNDLIDLLSDCDGECLVPTSELVKPAFEFGRDNEIKCHFNPINSSSSSKVMGLPEGSSLAFSNSLTKDSFNGSSSTGCQSILSQNSWSSSESVPVLMNSSNMSFFRISSLATSDQLTQENCFISDLNLSDRDRVMVGIFYISPLFTSSSNFLNCSTFLANLSFRKADQLISGCSSILFFNSSGIDTVSVAILLPPQDSVNTQNTVGIYKYKYKYKYNNLYLNKLGIPPCSEIQEGYCQDEDGKIYKQGWKFFSELNKNEKVLTLNPETKEKEWQLPTAYQTYDHNDEMYEIELEDGSTLLVSPEHKVYGKIENKQTQINPNILNISLSSNTFSGENNITSGLSMISLIQEPFQKNENKTLVSITNRSIVISYPYSSGCSFFNLLCRDSFTSSPSLKASSSVNSDLSKALSASLSKSCLFNSWDTTSSNFLDQSTLGNMSILCLISSGTLTTISPISITNNNINSMYINNFSLLNISEVHDELSDKQLIFLDSELNPVKVKSIKKVPYSGKIYDVDVPNDIVLVRRHKETTRLHEINTETEDKNKNLVEICGICGYLNETTRLHEINTENKNLWESVKSRGFWSGNSNSNYDLQFLEVRCGEEVLDYEWINNSVFIENYECDETGYEISKVITPGKHTLEFTFGDDTDYANNLALKLNITLTPILRAKKDCFALHEKPEFSFEYITEEEFKAKKVGLGLATLGLGGGERYNKKGLKTLVTPKETIKTFVYDYKGELTDIEPEIEELREGKFAIKLPKERAFRAGIYKLKVELVKDGVTYTQEQEFTWGVLAINTHKSIYLPNEIVDIGIAVLDNEGHMVCDADVTLAITDPDNKETVLSTGNGLIKVSPECSVYGVTNLPDYYTNYGVSGVGTYVMNLTAVTPDGTKSITDDFTVQNSVDFDVARDGPTRIYPPVPYVMSFNIKANRDYTGLIKEYVPASFVIAPQHGLTVTTVGDTKILTWNEKLAKGETYNIAYEFDAPDISPYLFILGELEIGGWQEARQWQIAADALDAPVFDAVTTDHSTGDRSSASFTHICSGTNRLLILISHIRETTVSSATYGGQSLALQRREQITDATTEVWYLVNPPSGANTLVVNFASGTNDCDVQAAISFTGVNQTNPIGADAGAQAASGSANSVAIATTTANSLIVGGCTGLGGDTQPMNPGTNVTERYDLESGTSKNADVGAAGGEMDAATVDTYTFGWTMAVSDDHSVVAVEVKPADKPDVTDLIPAPNSQFNASDTIEIGANVTDTSGVDTVYANITYPNSTIQQIELSNSVGDKYNSSFTIPYLKGRYNVTFIANDTSNNVNNTETTYFTLVDDTPPRVVIIHPLEHIFDENSDLAITVDAIDLTAVDTILANITFPNQTLSINLSGFDYGLSSDDFETDTEGVNWVKKNITSSGQSCIVDINSTVPGKMFISVDGGTGPTTAQCGFNSLKRLDGDFDVNISFNISVFENDTLFSFRSNSRDSFSPAGLRVFTDIEKKTGVIKYTFGYNNGSGTTDTSVTTTDTSGKFRIKRYNTTETPTFNLYYWNNTGDTWVNLLGDISLPGSSRVQFIQVKPASVASNYGMLNITLDNFSFSGDAYKFAIFNQTAEAGIYNFTIIANDTSGYVNDSESSWFNVTEINDPPSRPFITEPNEGDTVSELFNIIWSQVIDDEGDSLQFNITLLNPDKSFNATIVSNYGNSSTTRYERNTTAYPDGIYSLRIIVFENETAEGLSTTETLAGNITVDNTPPRVVLIHPWGSSCADHYHGEDSDVDITVDVTDPLSGVDTILANITFPNQTLSINLSGFDYGLQSDDFETDTEDVNWVHANSTLAAGQSCYTDINGTYPGKMFIASDGGTGPGMHCAYNSIKRANGNYDLNLTFNITHMEDDTFFTLRSAPTDSMAASGLRAYISLQESGGNRIYRLAYNNGTDTYKDDIPTTDTYGKFRIKRSNMTGAPVFNLYYWNNTGNHWIESSFGNISIPGCSRIHFIQIKPGSSASTYGALNVTIDDFQISGDNYKFAIFNQTADIGIYNVTIIANDTLGNVNDTIKSSFEIEEINDPPSRPYFEEPDPGDIVTGSFKIIWGQVTDDENDKVRFNITLLNSDGSYNSTIASNYGDINTLDYQWDTTTHSDGLYSMNITVYENETAEGLSTSDTLGGNFTIDNTLPEISIDEPTEASPVYKKGGELFFVNFTYTENNPKNYTVTIYNSTATINTSSNTTYTPNSYVNESFNLNSTAADGKYNVTVEMYDNASNYNISYQNNSVVKWGWSNVTWISPPDSSEYTVGDTITLTCLVMDVNSSTGIANYPVHFYNRTNSTVTYDFGVNYTNSSGYAVMDWDTTGVALGWYYPKCNITDNSTLFYNVSAPYEVNTSIKLAAPVTGTENLTPDSLTGTVDNPLADVQSSNDSRIGVDKGNTGGVTFTNTLIPAGSTINSVVIYYEHWEEAGHTADSITIMCGNSTDASAFGSGTVTDNIGPNSNTQGEAVPAEETDSFTCSPTPSLSQLNDLQVVFFNDDGGGSDEMWIDYVYAVVDYYTPVAITFISQYPAAIYENSTGPFNVTWLITTEVGELNSSSVSLVWTVWDSVHEEYHWSLRVPSNNKSAVCSHCGEQIIRADNRNSTTQRLNFEDNDTITEGNVWKWAGADENITRLTIQPINSSHSYVHWNGTFEDTVFENMYYLDRTRLERENSKHYNISKNDTALIKFWDGKAIHGATDYKIHVLLNATKQGTPSAPLQIYYLNESYVINGSTLPHEDGTNATYLTEYNSTTVDDYTYTQYNSSFVKFTINVSNGMIGPVNATPHGYIYFQSQTEESNAYRLAYVNGASGKNISFAETNVAWTSSDNGATFTQAAWTPKLFLDFSYSGQQHQMKLYAADTSDNWGNSTLLTNDIGLVDYPPTTPNINHFHYAGAVDYDMDGSYTGTFEIGIGVATDPDGGNVTHNLTLHYGNETFVAIINSTFNDTDVTHDGIYADISFNASPYSSVPNYTLRCVATDDEGKTSETWLGVNFTFDHQSPTITIDEPTESSPVYRKGGEQFYVNFTYTEENPKNYTVKIYNGTATINSSSNTTYTPNSYVNESFYLNSTAADGWYNVSVEMYDNASNYNISYQNESVVKMSWSNVTWISPPGGNSYEVGEKITLTCLVRDANTSSPIENYPVRFYNRTDSSVTHDFGVNYTNSSGYAVMDWNTTGVATRWYYPMCNITDNATLFYNVSTPYEANTSIELTTLALIPDLRVVNVTFDNWKADKASVTETGTGYHVKEGVNITVNATIANYGTGNVTSNFNVSFFDSAGVSGDWNTWFGNYTYNVSAEGELGNTSTVYPYNTTYAIAYWDSSLVGTHNISAWADPDNSAGEPTANVTDNNGSALINVSAWQKYWGNVSGSIVLASAAASNMSTWEWPAGSEGNLYIVNHSATINWTELHGLGCDKNNNLNATGNDFSEADNALNMQPTGNNATGFINNNITELFCGGDSNTATNTTYFIVHGTNITNVSIVNSTNMTNHTDVENANFVTGILWDQGSGSGAVYYDGTQKLVFIANIKHSETDNDYKVATPCALNAAIGGDLDFYVELR